MYVWQRSLLYFPQPAVGRDDTQLMRILTDAGHTLVATRAHDGPAAVVYFGGNGDDVTATVPELQRAFPNAALYLEYYRSYGGSDGKPTETALFADALALVDRVQTIHPKITVVGRSLGSGVAIYVASHRTVERLVMITPYDSIVSAAAHRYPFVPVRWLIKDRFESFKYAPDVTAPTLVLAAEHDRTIPRDSTERLMPYFKPGVATMVVLEDVGHNDVQRAANYLPLLAGHQ